MAPDDIAIREDAVPKLHPCWHIDDSQRGDLPKRVVANRRESAGATVGAVRALRACIEFAARPAVGADAVQSACVLAQPCSGGQDDLMRGAMNRHQSRVMLTVVSAVPRNALLPILKMTAGHKNVLSWEQ